LTRRRRRVLDGRPSLRFAAGWLALREDLDRAARDRVLPRALAQCLPDHPRLLDLGAGAGGLFRFLAPIIGRSQTWTFADADENLLDTALALTAGWARRRGFAATSPRGAGGSSLVLGTPGGSWCIETQVSDLAEMPRGLPLQAVDAVVCSALLDLVSGNWMERLVAALRVPFYASMTVDGRDAWLPRHAADRAVQTAFRADQRRDKGLGMALGDGAPGLALRLLGARGFETRTAASDWLIPGSATSLTRLFVAMAAGPARQAMPAQAAKFTAWSRARLDQAARARLAIRIGHRDILAFPRGG
jgi:hypothetical protein